MALKPRVSFESLRHVLEAPWEKHVETGRKECKFGLSTRVAHTRHIPLGLTQASDAGLGTGRWRLALLGFLWDFLVVSFPSANLKLFFFPKAG